MALRATHELHQRRFGRNLGVALCLGAFVAIVFTLTMVKIQRGDSMEGFDHTSRETSASAADSAAPVSSAPAAGEVQP